MVAPWGSLKGLMRMSIFRIGTVVLALGLSLAAAGAGALEIASHRGFYALKLSSARQGGAFVDARGGLDMTIEKTCDGWLLSQDLAMELATAQGDQVRQAVRYSGWESLDSAQYRFISKTRTDRTQKDTKGTARAGAGDKPGEAVFENKQTRKVSLPPGTRFPIAHAVWLIERALAGVHQAPSVVFDGTDGEGPQRVAAFIGRKIEAKDHGRAALGALADQAGWTMRLAFFPEDGTEASPEYEMEILQLANGVAPRMVIDYRDFSVELEIQKIEPIATPSCR